MSKLSLKDLNGLRISENSRSRNWVDSVGWCYIKGSGS